MLHPSIAPIAPVDTIHGDVRADCMPQRQVRFYFIDIRNATLYIAHMIKTFRHKGLQVFFESGSKAGIQPHHASKLKRQLVRLDLSKKPADMNVPGWRLHQLSTGHWSIWVNGNWRMTFDFDGENAVLVDYQDYH